MQVYTAKFQLRIILNDASMIVAFFCYIKSLMARATAQPITVKL